MTLLITNPKPQRTGSWQKGKLTFTEHYDVESDSDYTDPYEVLEFVSSLVINVFHSTVLTSINVNQVAAKIWTADCQWETLTPGERGGPVSFSLPTNRATVYSFTTRDQEVIADEDVNGDKILNAAGDPFDPAPTARSGTGVLIAKHNYVSLHPNVIANYYHHINSSAIFGFGIGCVFLANVQVEEQSEIIADVQYDYVSATFEFEIASPDHWQLRVLERGFRCYNDDGDKVNIEDDLGVQVTVPALLDADGKKLPEDGTPLYLERQLYPYVDFTLLGLT